MKNSAELRAGEWVQVRSKEEILATLDKNGQLEGLPFMPEMFAFCGRQFQVFKRAHKTCDPPNGLSGRRMLHTVHLERNRCDGNAHDGCQARCLIFWKESWLKRISTEERAAAEPDRTVKGAGSRTSGATEQDVVAGTRRVLSQTDSGEPVWVCQSTQIAHASHPLHWWNLRQYVEDYTSGNVRLSQLLASFLFFLYAQLVSAGFGLGSALRWVYDVIQKMRGATPYPMRLGKVPRGAKTPSAKLDVQPGELVKIRSYEEILATLDENGLNRGMWFDAEMVPYCGGTYRVLNRVNRIINEKTGKMQDLKNDCIMLDNVVCLACYSKFRRFCPRSIYPYWREIWLERVVPQNSASENARERETVPS
ncbi:MAG: hypothetical protein LAO24_04310 [Acidobacteriia bacterium]|nr:hypothetical protein [Terriglobia bacterium]